MRTEVSYDYYIQLTTMVTSCTSHPGTGLLLQCPRHFGVVHTLQCLLVTALMWRAAGVLHWKLDTALHPSVRYHTVHALTSEVLSMEPGSLAES